VVVVGGILRIGGETFEARGGSQKGRRNDGKRALAFALVLVFVDRVHDRGQDTRVPSGDSCWRDSHRW